MLPTAVFAQDYCALQEEISDLRRALKAVAEDYKTMLTKPSSWELQLIGMDLFTESCCLYLAVITQIKEHLSLAFSSPPLFFRVFSLFPRSIYLDFFFSTCMS